ncbi:MAG: GNAT family N-acetyltransferase [Phycisphaerae bacterium]
MSGDGDQFEVRRITADSPDHHLALHLAFGLQPPPGRASPARQVADLLANVQRSGGSIDLLLGAYQNEELLCACLAVESPGAAALVLVPSDVRASGNYRATVAVLRALQTAAWQQSIALLEVLVAPESDMLGRTLHDAGFRYLTRLRYLRRHGAPTGQSSHVPRDLEWVRYAPDRELLFEDAVERTYIQSLDCPELTGLRQTAQVLAGHRATGVFDPALWWMAKRNGQPVGVILLNRILGERALEVVYMGVALSARGTGVADALLQRAVDAAAKRGVNIMALAVDQRNTSARRMYARWDFVETGVRDAWIASPPRV